MNWANIDIDSSDSEKENENDNDNDDVPDWGGDDNYLPDNWETAQDPVEVAKQKEEEEKRKKKEKEEALEAEKKRRQEIREEKKRQKELLLESYDQDDDDLFGNVEIINKQKEFADLNIAYDAFAGFDGLNTADPDKIDIGTYMPDTADKYNAFAKAIEKKLNQIFPEIVKEGKKAKDYQQQKNEQDKNKGVMIEYLIAALCKNFRAYEIADLSKSVDEIYNKKIKETKKGQSHKKNAKPSISYINQGSKHDDDDDFM